MAIVLVGLPGSGKSTIGRSLSRQLMFDFCDTDAEFERKYAITIKDYFEHHGEADFRVCETELLKGLLPRQRTVLSTGGGIVLKEENRQLLKQNADQVIYLKTSVAELMKRLRHDRQRPLLQGGELEAKLHQLAEVREPLYAEVAGMTVETQRQSIHRLVQDLCEQLHKK